MKCALRIPAFLAVAIAALGASCRGSPKDLRDARPPETAAPEAVPRAAGDGAGAVPNNTPGPIPPEGIDHLAVTMTVELEFAGIGRDRVELRGTAVVHRGGPADPGGKEAVGDVVSLSLRGTSALLGSVVAMESPIQHSRCRYVCEGTARYSASMEMNVWLWLPDHRLLVFGARAIRLAGSSTGVPVVGQRAAMTGGEIPLFDFASPAARSVGRLAGAAIRVHEAVHLESYLRTVGTTVPALSRPARSPR